MTAADHAQVIAVMETYFEGLHHADSTTLRRVFHPGLTYVCTTEGDELSLSLDAYMMRVDGREPPASRRETRKEDILEIAFASARIARVTARMRMMGRDYLDVLTLVHLDDRWQIVAKVFTFLPQKD